MALYVFRLPDVGEGIAEAEIAAWHVAVGDQVDEDRTLVDVMTDKATVDMTSPVSGKVVAIHGAIGDRVPVGSPLVELEVTQDQTATRPETVAPSQPKEKTPSPRSATSAPRSISSPSSPAPLPPSLPLAAPATRKRAADAGIALDSVRGTGPDGRITPEDLERHIAAANQPPEPGVREIKIIGVRRKIAEKMQEAKRRIPHFGYVEEFDLTELEALRAKLNAARAESQPKLTLLPFFMRALVQLLPQFPHINARYDDDAGVLRQYESLHVGIATQTPNGLMVAVVRHAEKLDLWASAQEVLRVTAAAREGTAKKEELSGSTITITSLGTLGGISTTPIVNHPEVAIVGPNKLVERAVVREGQIVVRLMMNVSSAFDHRIVDGYDAAQFIQGLKRLLEEPAQLSGATT